jgi:hypothetical protein
MELKNTDVEVTVGAKIEDEMFTEEHFPVYLTVEKGDVRQIFKVKEVEKDETVYRTFTIEGIPKVMFDEKVVAGVRKLLGLHMQELVKIQ